MEQSDRLRLDKWLWAARFFKTRALATEAVDGGRVHLNGQRVKPARDVKIGDLLEIVAGESRWTVRVRGINEQRRPAAEARLLYEETPESEAARAQAQESRKVAADPAAQLHGRPTKRDRRRMDRLG
ncbi:MAG: S4 domain-containing protein [Rhodocyclaceae bacterium]|nr:S4 domain-containing protein [Rhodocyclaceae bacterium]